VTDTPQRFYPNRFARLLIQAMQTELGEYSTETLLTEAALPTVLPPDTLDREYPFVQLAALNRALLTTYGDKGGGALGMTIGQTWFDSLATFGAFAAFNDPAFLRLPLDVRSGIGVKVLGEVFSRMSDQTSTYEYIPNAHHLAVEHSPFVYDDAKAPTCHLISGLLIGCQSAATGGMIYAVREIECRSTGGARCLFSVSTKPVKRSPIPTV
jgi:hypothetical protein